MDIDRNELDRYITGNYGEDQLHEEVEPEFYAPWRLTKPYKSGSQWVVWDDNGNPMAYADEAGFLAEAVKRINAHDDLLDALERLVHMAECDTVPGRNTLEQARAAIAKARSS